jgi:NADPH:quinone reductase-like Zn-dependent oxidoreductase
MKAAVIYGKDGTPQYIDFPEPIAQNGDEILISIKAAAVKHNDKSRASGKHYSVAEIDLSCARVIGGDGIGVLSNGTRVYAIGSGMVAEKAIIEKDRIVKVPKELDDVSAAALPNAVIGSAMALLFRARMKRSETIMINGATGFTGKIAVQIAKYYGAGKIIVTGRNEQELKSLLVLGADEIISVQQSDEIFVKQIKNSHNVSPIDIVIDYLWGHTAELILEAFKGQGSFTHKTRFVSIGAVTGDKIQLSAEVLRSVDLQLSGSGLGSWKRDEVRKFFHKILPKMFQLAAKKELKVDTVSINLKDIESLWDREIPNGKRLVIVID